MTWWKASSVWAAAAVLAACGGQSLRRDGGEGASDAGEGAGGASGGSSGGVSRGGFGGVNTGALGGTTSTAGVAPTGGSVTTTGGIGGTVAGGSSAGGSSNGGDGIGGGGRAGTAGVAGCELDASSPRFTFETDPEGWFVEYTTSTGESALPIDWSLLHVGWTGDDGMPEPGALEVEIPFSSGNQIVGIAAPFAIPVDLSTRVVSVCIRVASGLGDPDDLRNNPAGVRLTARSGPSFCYANGPYNNITSVGDWTHIRFDLRRSPDYVDAGCTVPFDPTEIRQLGVEFASGATTTTATAAVVRIDTLSY